MSKKTLIALLAFAATDAAFAASLGDFGPAERLSIRSRTDVLAELRTAMHDGTVAHGGPSDVPVPASTASRSQVIAELRQAMQLGDVETNDAEMHAGAPAAPMSH